MPALPVALLAATLLVAPPAAATPAPTPTPPPPLPAATSTVGGARLAGTTTVTDLPAGIPAPTGPGGSAWLVADLDSGAVLAGHGAHAPLAPASTLKILTALALVPRLNPKAVYVARYADVAIDGTKVGLVPGSRYTVDDLVHGLLMSSGNDCASALANLVGGPATAVTLMSRTARELGAADTVVRNTSGLDAPGQVSSAYDLALFARAALADPYLERVMTTVLYNFPAKGTTFDRKRPRFQIQTHNKLLRNYPGTTGVKNGYTVLARGSFVGSAARGTRRYVATLLRVDGNTWHATRALLDWAFRYGTAAHTVGTLDAPPVDPPLDPQLDGATPQPTASGNGSAGGVVSGLSGDAARLAGSKDRLAVPSLPLPVTVAVLTGGLLLVAAMGGVAVRRGGRRPRARRVR